MNFMAERISRKPDELAQQCGLAAYAIGTVPAWPPVATMTTCASNLSSQLSVINSLEAQLRAARQALKPMIEAAHDAMAKGDQATDLLYGPDGAEKQNFGLPSKKTTQTPSGEPEQVVITATADGTHPAGENRGLAQAERSGDVPVPAFPPGWRGLREPVVWRRARHADGRQRHGHQ